MELEGSCHCGAVRFTFETAKALTPRACRCGFCRRHATRMVSDPDGAAELTSSVVKWISGRLADRPGWTWNRIYMLLAAMWIPLMIAVLLVREGKQHRERFPGRVQ